ncbi:MAG: hypothetical protein ACE5GM_05940 [bacterium]
MKKSRVFHPFLFVLYPVLFLYAHNKDQFHLKVIFAPLAVLSLFSLAVLWGLNRLMKDYHKTGIVLSAFFLLFFSFQHFFKTLERVQYIEWYIGTTRTVGFIFLVLFSLVCYVTARTQKNLDNFTAFANLIAAVLVVFSAVEIGAYEFNSWINLRKGHGPTGEKRISPEKLASLPNIYYIILDAYTSGELLKKQHRYDNSAFINFLRKKGFYLAGKSQSNYIQTALSLSSSLNFDYLPGILPDYDKLAETGDHAPLNKLIRYNRVSKVLKRYGYQTVAFETGYSITEIGNSDIYLAPETSLIDEFQMGLIDTTVIPVLLKNVSNYYFETQRKRVLYTLSHLGGLTGFKKPTFVFAHLTCPHVPYVFGPNGEDGSQYKDKPNPQRYVYQVRYINQRMEKIIDRILSNSKIPPVIVIQGDHGNGCGAFEAFTRKYLSSRFAILNAYYLPGDGAALLYENISPVNTFRVVLNKYLGTDFKLLRDEHFYSNYKNPYKFVKIKKQLLTPMEKYPYK